MTEFEKTRLTDKGVALLARGGMDITFTKVMTGCGTYEEGEDISGMTELKIPKQNVNITNVEKKTDTLAVLKFTLSNRDIVTAYTFSEIGIYANDPDEGEILFAVCCSTPEKASEIPAYNGIFAYTAIMLLNIEVSAEGEVFAMSSAAYALEEDLERIRVELLKALNEKAKELLDSMPAAVRVKGEAENTFRTGDVNITKGNLGIKDMTGATASKMGTSGLVPTPPKGANDKVLRGDGTWGDSIGKITYRYTANDPRTGGVTSTSFSILENKAYIASIVTTGSGSGGLMDTSSLLFIRSFRNTASVDLISGYDEVSYSISDQTVTISGIQPTGYLTVFEIGGAQ